MNYRNKLGTFTFDDDVQESHMKLIVQNVTGQYLIPKKGEPELTDEESCYAFIRERCGNVLSTVGFELEINEDVRIWTKEQLVAKKIRDFDAKIQQVRNAFKDAAETIKDVAERFDVPEATVRPSFGGWLVGPAAVK
jgi:hypothetical protein